MYFIDDIKTQNKPEHLVISKHAKDRMVERNISVDDVLQCIDTGEVIEQYEDDKPFPSCLILGNSIRDDKMHIVVSMDDGFIYIITAYYPDMGQWEADFKVRKK